MQEKTVHISLRTVSKWLGVVSCSGYDYTANDRGADKEKIYDSGNIHDCENAPSGKKIRPAPESKVEELVPGKRPKTST
jgi:hypothetical protein